MKQCTFFCLVIFFSLLGFTACNTEEPNPENSEYDVYVLGEEDGVVKYWKNGESVTVGEGTAKDIAVTGNDVYVVGNFKDGDNWQHKCLKNGTPLEFTETPQFLNTIILKDADVYVGGNINTGSKSVAAYWKNGTTVQLPSTEYAEVYGLCIDGTDVYAAGVNYNSARYWKNGVAIALSYQAPSATHTIGTSLTDILIAGNGDVYTVGDQYAQDVNHKEYIYSALQWVNTTPACLAETRASAVYRAASIANAIEQEKEDIYIAGQTTNDDHKTLATYWKNGAPSHLTTGERDASAMDIAVIDGDIHVVGYEQNDNKEDVARYWKNGEAVEGIFGQSTRSRAVAIILVPKK